MNIDLVPMVVDEYDLAIRCFVGARGFELVEDSAALTNVGEPHRSTGAFVAPPSPQHPCSAHPAPPATDSSPPPPLYRRIRRSTIAATPVQRTPGSSSNRLVAGGTAPPPR